MENLTYKLEVFEGPMDLLLHLISKHKLNINDIPIVELVNQYLDYVRQMEDADFDIAGDFLEMAARLIYIKTVSLLPRHEEAETLKKELTGELIEYRDCKLMAEKLSQLEESRREFVANVSHELRSPITAISGYVEGMRDGTIGQEDYPQYLTIVSDETTRLKNLIGDLLKLSRLEKADAALNKTNFDICKLLSRVLLHRTGDLEAKKMDVECDFAPEPCMVSADESRIEQVAVNLLDNAIKFTPDGGVIRMSVRVNQGICTVIVQDNGVGISPEDRPHVFERFYTADKAHTSGKGTGLGLSICQRIMEMHGQKITLMDTGDEAGAAFAFTLDCAK